MAQSVGASQVAPVVKNLPASAGHMRQEFDPWVRKIPWRRAWQPTPVFLPRESHEQRSLVGYILYGPFHGRNKEHSSRNLNCFHDDPGAFKPPDLE